MIENTDSALDRFTSQFTEERLSNVTKIGREYYQVSQDLKEVMDSVRKKTKRTPFCAGLFLGEEKGKGFKPSVALIDLIGRASDKWVMIDEKAEWLFLCGRDVFASSVLRSNVKKGIALAVNASGEVLGYGKVTGKMEKKEMIFMENIMDKGDYLRREMNKKR